MVVTHSILMLAGWGLALSSELVNLLQVSGVVQLCNGFIQQNFSTHFVFKQESQSTGLFLRGMIYLMTFTGITGPIVIFLDILRNPCFPVYVGYWMNSQCEDHRPGYYLLPTWSFVEVLTKVSLSLASYLIWAPLSAGNAFIMSLEYIMEGNCFLVFIEKLEK